MKTFHANALFRRLTRLSRLDWLWFAPALLMALLLPLNLLTSQRFHHDEALYATWALPITSGLDPWLSQVAIDKPPLFLYIVAGSMRLLGVTETAARLPSLIATVFIAGLTFGLGRRLYGQRVGVLAAWLVVLSPFTIMFAPTALTDPLLVALVLAGCLAAAQGQAIWAGVWLGLAVATKQQGLFFAPLVMGLLGVSSAKCQVSNVKCQVSSMRSNTIQISPPGPSEEGEMSQIPSSGGLGGSLAGAFQSYLNGIGIRLPKVGRYVSRFTPQLILLLTTALTFLPAQLWDMNRGQSPGFWQLSLVNYGGLSATGNFNERGWEFLELFQYGTASPLLNAIFAAGLPLLLIYDIWQMRNINRAFSSSHLPISNYQLPITNYHSPLTDWLLALFAIAFLLGHILLSFQVWDRYLLGLIPILALLLARVLWQPWLILRNRWLERRPDFLPLAEWLVGGGLILLLSFTLARPVQAAVNGRYPLGSNSAALSGIEQISAYLRGNVGANTTLYHRWLGTHWHFYLWNYPYDLQYWASPQALAAQAKAGQLIAFPAWRSETEARLALAEADLRLSEVARAYHPAGYPSIILYRIVEGKN